MVALFTIGFVNYKSSIYMETQLKIYQHFAGEGAQIFIVDTSNVDSEYNQLKKIKQKFSGLHIRLFRLDTRGKYASDAHGTGLQYLYKKVDTDYFLTQDPDFFWVFPGFLTYFKEKLQTNIVVGASYHTEALAGWSGHPWFPAAFGAAHQMKALREVEADFRYTNEFIGGVLKDVGWQVREKLKDRPYYYFPATKTHLPVGMTYCRTDWQKYMDGPTLMAYHIVRGTFETKCSEGLSMAYGKVADREKLRLTQAPMKWQQSRRRSCMFFWKTIKEADRRSRG